MSRARIRVLHLITRLDPGGSAENTLLTVERLDPERFEPVLASGPTQDLEELLEKRIRKSGVAFHFVPHLVRSPSPWRDLLALGEILLLMKREKFHIVHTHSSKAGLLGRIAARLAGVPAVVHTPHGHVFYGYYGPVLSRIFVLLERWVARFADRIVALTGREVAEYEAFGVAGPEQCVVIHSGVDFAPFDQEPDCRDEVRAEWGIPPEALVVGSSGRLTRIKGLADLVEAFARMQAEEGNAFLVLIGEGEERRDLEEQIRSLGVEGQVRITGWRADVHRLLRGLDLFVLPSLNEGMGKALVEAMYAGLPCVATRVGGIPELIEDGRDGLLVEPERPDQLAEALLALARNPERRRTFGAAARRRAEAYSIGRMIEKIEALYDRLLEEKKIAVD